MTPQQSSVGVITPTALSKVGKYVEILSFCSENVRCQIMKSAVEILAKETVL